MIRVIDNYASFTYNLVQRLGELGAEIKVFRNDKITACEAEALAPSHLIVSPGPCTPNEAGISNDVIRHFAGKIPVLGVCLGHQCIADAFGGKVTRADRLMHGKVSRIHHDGKTVYRGLPNPFVAAALHPTARRGLARVERLDDVLVRVARLHDERLAVDGCDVLEVLV